MSAVLSSLPPRGDARLVAGRKREDPGNELSPVLQTEVLRLVAVSVLGTHAVYVSRYFCGITLQLV